MNHDITTVIETRGNAQKSQGMLYAAATNSVLNPCPVEFISGIHKTYLQLISFPWDGGISSWRTRINLPYIPNTRVLYLSNGQPQMGIIFFYVKFDIGGHLIPKIKGIFTNVFGILCPNLLVQAWTGDEVAPGLPRDWHTDSHTQTDAGNDNFRRPKLASGKSEQYLM